jgi:hypothetical protein
MPRSVSVQTPLAPLREATTSGTRPAHPRAGAAGRSRPSAWMRAIAGARVLLQLWQGPILQPAAKLCCAVLCCAVSTSPGRLLHTPLNTQLCNTNLWSRRQTTSHLRHFHCHASCVQWAHALTHYTCFVDDFSNLEGLLCAPSARWSC